MVRVIRVGAAAPSLDVPHPQCIAVFRPDQIQTGLVFSFPIRHLRSGAMWTATSTVFLASSIFGSNVTFTCKYPVVCTRLRIRSSPSFT